MPLEELRREGLLMPERYWGDAPEATLRSRLSVLFTFGLGIAAAALIWLGDGGWVTFVGTGIFLVDLFLILWTTFLVVDVRVDRLESMDLGGEVEGLTEDEGRS
jgi:protein-S-isoprenylcysteine O-methyltransferase Ste14